MNYSHDFRTQTPRAPLHLWREVGSRRVGWVAYEGRLVWSRLFVYVYVYVIVLFDRDRVPHFTTSSYTYAVTPFYLNPSVSPKFPPVRTEGSEEVGIPSLSRSLSQTTRSTPISSVDYSRVWWWGKKGYLLLCFTFVVLLVLPSSTEPNFVVYSGGLSLWGWCLP